MTRVKHLRDISFFKIDIGVVITHKILTENLKMGKIFCPSFLDFSFKS